MRAFNNREKDFIKMLAKINLANNNYFSYFLQDQSNTQNSEMNNIIENHSFRFNEIDKSIEQLTLDLKKELTDESKDRINSK